MNIIKTIIRKAKVKNPPKFVLFELFWKIKFLGALLKKSNL